MISLNSDAFTTGSTYIYKDRDPEGGVAKLYWGPLCVTSDPSPARIDDFRYEAEDPSVVTVNRMGVLKASGAGRTVVHVKTETREEGGKKTLLETSVTVVVEEGETPSEEPSKETEPSKESETPGPSSEAERTSHEETTEAETPGPEGKGFDWNRIWIPAGGAALTAAVLLTVVFLKKRRAS